MATCNYFDYTLEFNRPAGTSRGILFKKKSYFIQYKNQSGHYYGECGLLAGLSIDDRPGYEKQLAQVCKALEKSLELEMDLSEWPSIQCGVEMIQYAVQNDSADLIFKNEFYTAGKAMPINGLIWMGDPTFMRNQIRQKIEQGFACIKMKIGAIDWEVERTILDELRVAGGKELIIRVDANGAWNWSNELKEKLDFLHSINVHSIEQPIATNQFDDLAEVCSWSPVPIALDEELFEQTDEQKRERLLDYVKPQYIVLKPSLVGGFRACDSWIGLCQKRGVGYWMTSALESNVGLNAIAQYTYEHHNNIHQGLGTGSLYENNIPSPLRIQGEHISYDKTKHWDYKQLR